MYAQVADVDEEAAGVLREPLQEALRMENVIAQHAAGTPATCIDRLTNIVERSGVGRVILVAESAVFPTATLVNVRRLGRRSTARRAGTATRRQRTH